jgi:N-acetylmuramoyl-L-alanine amidase
MTYKTDSAVTHIVLHYSATPIERDFTAADIDEMHRKRGFRKIGYHYFIRKDGTAETGRDLSEPGRFEVGAHSKGENSQSIGICFEGGVRSAAPNVGFDSRTPAQIKAMINLIEKLQIRFPGAIVEGHRDMPGAATQCPGFSGRDWWSGVLKARANKPARKSKAQSTTLQATSVTAASILTACGTVLSKLDPVAQIVVVACAAISLVALGWIARERIRKWAEGDR